MQRCSPEALTPSVLCFGWELLLFAPPEDRSWPGKLCPAFVLGKPSACCFRSEKRTSRPPAAGQAGSQTSAMVCLGVAKCGNVICSKYSVFQASRLARAP